jgi:hypothetical protein
MMKGIYTSCGGGPPSRDVCLRGGERSTDPALGAMRPMASTLPWMVLGSEVEIGSPNGSRDSWWSVQPGDGGAMLGGSRDESLQ